MLAFIEIDLQLYKIFKITRVLLLDTLYKRETPKTAQTLHCQ